MKKSMHLFCFFITLSVLGGCFDYPASHMIEDELMIDIKYDRFEVENLSDSSVYYFVVERSMLPMILWFPISTEDNEIKQGQLETFLLEEIGSMSNGTTGEIAFFYWFEIAAEPGEYTNLNQVIIDPRSGKVETIHP